MIFKELLDSWEKYGIVGVCIAAFFSIIYLVFKSSWFSELATKFSDKFIDRIFRKKDSTPQIKTITESDITNHDIFNYIDFWINSRVPTFQFSTDYRTIVFRKYLTIFLKNHKEDIRNYVNKKDYENMDDSQLWTSLLGLINNIIYNYEREMESTGIPKVIIDKMKVKNNDTISLTIDLIEGICNSQFYYSDKNFLKIYSILNIILSILENTIYNSNNICNSINGQLKGMSMDGRKEP